MDLFVLDTPLQLLNALEARHYFGGQPSALVLLHWPAWPVSAFECLLNEMTWQSTTWVPMNAQRSTQKYWLIGSQTSDRLNEYRWIYQQYRRRNRIDRVLARFGRISRLVVGNLYNDYMSHVSSHVPHDELIAIDDGTDTLRVAMRRHNAATSLEQTTPLGPIQALKHFIQNRWVFWDGRQPNAITFFTAYDIAVGSKDRLIVNDYRWLRERVVSRAGNDYVYFLGQPLIEDGYLEEITYLEYLRKVVRYYGDNQVVYIPHKRESNRSLILIDQELGLAIQRFSRPIEVELAIGGELPKELASFFCSALENCSILFGNSLQIKAFYIPSNVQLFQDSPSEGIYNYFRHRQTESFRVMEI